MPPQVTGDVVRLVSWNLRDLTGDPAAVKAVLLQLNADVYLLQEVPRRMGASWRLAALLRGTVLRSVPVERGSGGTAIVLGPRARVVSARTLSLPVPSWHTRRRGAVVATLECGALQLRAASIHLPLSAQERLEHAIAVRNELTVGAGGSERVVPERVVPDHVVPGHVVVGGDFNEGPGGPAWQCFAPGVKDPAPDAAPTFPAASPTSRLDAVLVSAQLDVVHYGVPDLTAPLRSRASDHLPVVADVRALRC